MTATKQRIEDLFLVTDFVANGSFASLKANVKYLSSPDYAVLVRLTDHSNNWNGKYVYVSKQSFQFLSKSTVYPGDLIINNVGDTGKAFLVPSLQMPMTLGPNSILVRPLDKAVVDINYIYYFIKSPVGRKAIEKISSATTLKKFNKTAFRKIEIYVPSLHDQLRIACTLGQVELLISQRRESLRLLDELLKSTFLEMFGDPVRNEKGWERVPLSTMGKLDRGVSKHRPRNAPELLGGSHPLIQTGDIAQAGLYLTSFNQTYSDAGLHQSRLWKKGTLCITIAANIGKTSILSFDACFPDSVVGFITDETVANTIYIYFLFSFLQTILEKNAPQSAQKNINLELLRPLPVPRPPITLQNQFAHIVVQAEALNSHYRASLQELENLFGALSQKAFKGEL